MSGLRLMATNRLVRQICPVCGGKIWLLNGAQGGQKIDPEPDPEGVLRIEQKWVGAAVRDLAAEHVASYTLLPNDIARQCREQGERLHNWHTCNVEPEPERGPVTPWREHSLEDTA